MTHPSLRAHWSYASALLSVALSVALAAFATAPRGISVASAQACSPQIGIDAPAPGDTVSGSVSFSGWAVDLTSPGGSGVDQVRLYRDAPPEQGGTPMAVATVGVDRPDIDAANGLTGSMSGWTASVDFSDSPAGAATIYIYAHTICGWTYATQVVSVDSSNVAAPPAPAPAGTAISITMESPTAGALLNNGQALNISGWAVDASGAGTGVDTVRLFLDGPEGTGQALGWANYGRSRPDVVSSTGNSSWDKSGFDLVWPIAGISAGSHTLYVYAHSTASGQWDYTTVPVTVTSAGASSVPGAGATSATAPTNPNAMVHIESPTGNAPLSGPTVIRGYAVDCTNGNPATSVRFYAGTNTSGRLLGTVTVGAGPRDLTQICSGRGLTGTSNAGFTFTVDPQSLGGAQSVTIAADTTSGTGSTTLAFGGAAATTAGGSTGTSSGNCSAAQALSPFAVSCGSANTTATVTNSNPGSAPNPSATSSSYTACAPNYQSNGANTNSPYYQNNQAYMSAVQGNSPGCASTANNNYTACNPSYPQSNPNYPNNVSCSSTSSASYNGGYNPNTAYNSGQYNNGQYNNGQYNNGQYNNGQYNSYTSYNGVNYPSNQYSSGYNSNGYNPYYNNGQTLNGYSYTGTNSNPYYLNSNNYPYTNNSSQYGYPYYNSNYNASNSYGYPNTTYGYNGYNYNNGYNGYNNGYPYGYNGAYGNGASNLPPGYAPNYVYNGNAGGSYGQYGSPYGYNNYGYNNYGYPYGGGNGYCGNPYGC